LNSLKRLPFIRSGGGTKSPSPHRARPSATFYLNGSADSDPKLGKSNTLQVPSLDTPVSLPHLDRDPYPFKIDSARTSALAKIKLDFRSKSTSCLSNSNDVSGDDVDGPKVEIIVEKVRRKSHEVHTEVKPEKKSKKLAHRRSHSAVGLYRQDAFDVNDAIDLASTMHKYNDLHKSAEFTFGKELPKENSQKEKPFKEKPTKEKTSKEKPTKEKTSKEKSPKSNTFPRQMSPLASSSSTSQPNLGKKLLKSMSLMSSPVKQLSNFLSPHSSVDLPTSRYYRRRLYLMTFHVATSFYIMTFRMATSFVSNDVLCGNVVLFRCHPD
jgi:hypothetical protein